MRVLVTGTEGYIGSVLAPVLMRAGHEVVGADTGFYRSGWLYRADADAPRTLVRDIREITAADLRGFDAVVHLAELSNDPAGELNPRVTFEINHEGSVRLAEQAREAGVSRFVYASSCSVYGVADSDFVDETSPVSPQTAYAECKALVERDVGAMAADGFAPTFLRNSTAFGASPRLRFDVVVNNLCGHAFTSGRIKMDSDGTPWRPLVHILDISQAVARVLAAPEDDVRGQILNVGSDGQNHQIREVATIIGGVFPGCEVSFGPSGQDNRSYRVSFAKIAKVLPGYSCAWSVADGARQLRAVFERVGLTGEDFTGPAYIRLKRLQQLLASGQIDSSFYWVPPWNGLDLPR